MTIQQNKPDIIQSFDQSHIDMWEEEKGRLRLNKKEVRKTTIEMLEQRFPEYDVDSKQGYNQALEDQIHSLNKRIEEARALLANE
jgi:hypothetical protein